MSVSALHELCSESACAWALRYGFAAVAMNTQSAGGSGDCDAVAVGVVRGRMRSAVFESKVSRSDFFADRKKWHRQCHGRHPRTTEEWYVTPVGLVRPDELPDRWGLLEVDERGRASVTKRAVVTDINDETFREALLLAARACSQKYLTKANCQWSAGNIELCRETYDAALRRPNPEEATDD